MSDRFTDLRVSSGRRAWLWLKRIWIYGAVIVLLTDLIHFGLNTVYNPFTGPFDTALHGISLLHYLFYIPVSFSGFILLMESLRTRVQVASWVGRTACLILVIVLVLEVAYAIHSQPRGRSSHYYPLFPDFWAGAFVMVFCVLTTWCFESPSRNSRYFGYAIGFGWLFIPACVDLIYITEGTARGTGPLWNYPIVGLFATSIVGMVILIGAPLCVVGACSSWNNVNLWVGSGTLLVCILVWWYFDRALWREPGCIAQKLSLIFAAAVLLSLVPMWQGFILD